jgi:hypothetical protein
MTELVSLPRVEFLLSELPGIKENLGKIINYGGSRQTFSVESIGRALISKALDEGVESATDALLRFISEDFCSSVEVMLLEGLKVTDTIELCDGVFISKLEDVPSDALKIFLREFESKPLPPSAMAKTFHADDSQAPKLPDSALFRITKVRPKFFDANDPKFNRFDTESLALLEDVFSLLTLVGPSSPIIRRRYSDLEAGALMSGFTARSAGAQPEGTKVFTTYDATRDEFDMFKDVLQKYLKLPRRERKRLDVPLHRLNKAVRHKLDQGPKDALQDRAIDLAIALESLLLSDQNDGVQLTLNLKLRGAWLAGGDLVRRQKVYKLLGVIYNARSKAIHSGTAPSDTKDANKIEVSLELGLALCAELIVQVIHERPDWEVLILGGRMEQKDLS